MSQAALRATALRARHLALGAAMAPFAGWDMPLWYKSGAIKEHLAVIQAAGLFDTSHMDVVLLSGPDARKLLNFAFTRDIADLKVGRVSYGAFLTRQGHCIDDGIVYPLDGDRLAVVVNAGMGPGILDHLAVLPGAAAVTLRPPAERIAKLDVQGPASAGIMRDLLTDPETVLAKFPYFSFKGDFDFFRTDLRLADGTPALLSRTGYTGELGFELYVPVDRAEKVWDDIMRLGADRGLLPCGLAARDSLRTGAVLPLSHQDIGDWPFINHPWPFALPLDDNGLFTKPFFGAEALDAATAKFTVPFVGFDPRRVDSHAAKVLLDGEAIGRVSTIVSDMAIGRVDGKVLSLSSPGKPEGWTPRGLACGFVIVDRRLEPGTEIALADGRREIKVETTADIRPDRSARKALK